MYWMNIVPLHSPKNTKYAACFSSLNEIAYFTPKLTYVDKEL
jgi:hypothetical protein